ncbi:BTB/POZ domain-containing protein KCTD19-like [Branchiostoma lanceolatum]|uniref:BTB/POZ domain-containing protein KCTD19-like n=1 Tax=Branchiostoma lanceolatum TaxID=7740 RepID=UPI003455245C
MSSSNDIVTLNVGGQIYTTTRATLTRYPNSRLGATFSVGQGAPRGSGGASRPFGGAPRPVMNVSMLNRSPSLDVLRDEQGRFFIDRDGVAFRHVLNFLRLGRLVLAEGFKELDLLEEEASFYRIQPLLDALREMARDKDQDDDEHNAYGYDPWDYTMYQPRKAPAVQGYPDRIVYLNVGGHFYTTTIGTLARYPDSKLGKEFRDEVRQNTYDTYDCLPVLWDDRGRFFIDRDGMVFRHVLNFLRLGELVVPDGFRELRLLEKEAEFYKIKGLIRAVRVTMGKDPGGDEHNAYGYDPWSIADSVVSLNVGGHIYTTARSTLTRYPDSMLGAMFGGDLRTLQDDQGRYFIDRNGRLFEHVLNFLRTSQLVLPEDFKELPLLEMEADFYQIKPLIEALKS